MNLIIVLNNYFIYAEQMEGSICTPTKTVVYALPQEAKCMAPKSGTSGMSWGASLRVHVLHGPAL